jgi:hypothetical protein
MHDTIQGITLPSKEEIEAMDAKRAKAIESLQINETDNTVKCQNNRCNRDIPLPPKVTSLGYTRRVRIGILEARIKWIEQRFYHPYSSDHSKKEDNNIKELKAEHAHLLAEDKEYDKLRNLPLYSSRITNWLFYCGKCYDRAYYNTSRRRKSSL